jgi:hypothetical protein
MQAHGVWHHSHPLGFHALPQMRVASSNGSSAWTAVWTPQELLEAVTRGDKHILIRQHLDLTSIDALETGANPIILGDTSAIQSIRV